jgi:spermidine synthase
MNKKDRISFHTIFALIGFTAVIAQIIFIREFLIIFHGNEISFGIFLANWLLWTACGSFIFGIWIRNLQNPIMVMPILQLIIAIFIPATVLMIRFSRAVFQNTAGEILGLNAIFMNSFLILTVFCIISGGLFSAGAFLYAQMKKQNVASSSGRVYLWESIGSGMGGLLVSLFLITCFHSIQICLFISLANIFAAFYLLIKMGKKIIPFVSVIIGTATLFIIAGFDSVSYRVLWNNFPVLANQNSIYGNLTILEINGNRTLYENGLVIFTYPDQEMNEEAVHYPLLQHPDPQKVLLISGGISGTIGEILKYKSVNKIDYVELDPTILELAKDYFPQNWQEIINSSAVAVHHLDARLFLKQKDQRYDVVIVHLPDPHTAQLNRFYSEEFFRLVADRLNDRGILTFQLTASENYISDGLAKFLRCIHKTLLSVFKQVAIIPGNTIHFFATNQTETFHISADSLIAHLRERKIQTEYIREYYLPFRLMPDRLDYVKSMIKPLAKTPVNKDFSPIAYFFDLVLWTSQFFPEYQKIFYLLADLDFNQFMLTVCIFVLLLVVILFFVRKKDKYIQICSGFAILFMGFTSISLQIILLLAFQAIFGYVYHHLTLIIAFFMMGMAFASWMALKRIRGISIHESPLLSTIRTLITIHLIAALLSLGLLHIFQVLANVTDLTLATYLNSILFALLAFICGAVGGYQFPVVSMLYFSHGEELAESEKSGSQNSGIMYALDLTGAVFGALLSSIIIIPLFGLMKTAILLAVLNLVVIICLVAAYYLRK